MSLSDKAWTKHPKPHLRDWIYTRDVKNSIKELKEKQCKYVICEDDDKCTNCKIIEEVFGRRLTSEK